MHKSDSKINFNCHIFKRKLILLKIAKYLYCIVNMYLNTKKLLHLSQTHVWSMSITNIKWDIQPLKQMTNI